MAKGKSKMSSEHKIKVTFGKRRRGKHSKSSGPKAKSVSKYRGQGR